MVAVTNILLRARKDPFEVVSAEDTLIRNMIADNSGNLIFFAAAHKILATRGTTVTADRLLIDPGDGRRDQRAIRRLRHPARERLPATATSPSSTG